jgi:hypothetical protein
MCQLSRTSGDRRPEAIDPENLSNFNWFLKRGRKKADQKWFITLAGLGKVEPVGRFSLYASCQEWVKKPGMDTGNTLTGPR